MERKIPLICVVGPTASGKTSLAVALAKRLDGEVVSADSMQIYRGMDIGTAKPTAAEMEGIPHHLLGFLEPEQSFSVADYLERARAVIAEIDTRGKRPIVAGGTGLYISSLVDHVALTPMPADLALRAQLEQEAICAGNQALWERLHACDPILADRLHPNNRGRVIRALEVYHITGVPMSEHQRRSRLQPSPYEVQLVGLTFRDRSILYQRIDKRVDQMLSAGLLEEVKAFAAHTNAPTAAQAIGYKEFFEYLQGNCSLAEAVERVKRESRRYAKRQLTWFGRDARVKWIYVDECADATAMLQATVDALENTPSLFGGVDAIVEE